MKWQKRQRASVVNSKIERKKMFKQKEAAQRIGAEWPLSGPVQRSNGAGRAESITEQPGFSHKPELVGNHELCMSVWLYLLQQRHGKVCQVSLGTFVGVSTEATRLKRRLLYVNLSLTSVAPHTLTLFML